MSIRIAQAQQQTVKPAFVVQKLEGDHERPICKIDKEGKIVRTTVKETGGYLVSFPIKGNSIRVRNEQELKALGFDKTVPLVDAAGDDEVVGEIPNNVNE